MPKQSEAPESSPKFAWVLPRDGHPIPEIYANYILVSWTMYDIRARLGQLIPSGTGRRDFVVEERAALTLSWQHAKSVAALLAKMVGDYEKVNGEIPILKLPEESGVPEEPDKS